MRLRKLLIILMLLGMSSLLGRGQTPSPAQTGLEGVITISPIRPGPARIDMPDSGPLASIAFAVANEKGPVTSFVTDAQGRFSISLAPGHYTVKDKEGRIRHCGPFDVDVVAGKMTAVEWRCDSGMR
jgi:hypothetical protein